MIWVHYKSYYSRLQNKKEANWFVSLLIFFHCAFFLITAVHGTYIQISATLKNRKSILGSSWRTHFLDAYHSATQGWVLSSPPSSPLPELAWHGVSYCVFYTLSAPLEALEPEPGAELPPLGRQEDQTHFPVIQMLLTWSSILSSQHPGNTQVQYWVCLKHILFCFRSNIFVFLK